MKNTRITALGLAAMSLTGWAQVDTRQADIQALKDN